MKSNTVSGPNEAPPARGASLAAPTTENFTPAQRDSTLAPPAAAGQATSSRVPITGGVASATLPPSPLTGSALVSTPAQNEAPATTPAPTGSAPATQPAPTGPALVTAPPAGSASATRPLTSAAPAPAIQDPTPPSGDASDPPPHASADRDDAPLVELPLWATELAPAALLAPVNMTYLSVFIPRAALAARLFAPNPHQERVDRFSDAIRTWLLFAFRVPDAGPSNEPELFANLANTEQILFEDGAFLYFTVSARGLGPAEIAALAQRRVRGASATRELRPFLPKPDSPPADGTPGATGLPFSEATVSHGPPGLARRPKAYLRVVVQLSYRAARTHPNLPAVNQVLAFLQDPQRRAAMDEAFRRHAPTDAISPSDDSRRLCEWSIAPPEQTKKFTSNNDFWTWYFWRPAWPDLLELHKFITRAPVLVYDGFILGKATIMNSAPDGRYINKTFHEKRIAARAATAAVAPPTPGVVDAQAAGMAEAPAAGAAAAPTVGVADAPAAGTAEAPAASADAATADGAAAAPTAPRPASARTRPPRASIPARAVGPVVPDEDAMDIDTAPSLQNGGPSSGRPASQKRQDTPPRRATPSDQTDSQRAASAPRIRRRRTNGAPDALVDTDPASMDIDPAPPGAPPGGPAGGQ